MNKISGIITVLILTVSFLPHLAFAENDYESINVSNAGGVYGENQVSPIYTCQFNGVQSVEYSQNDEDDPNADADLNEETALVQSTAEAFESAFTANLSDENGNRCGETTHPTTGALEQADCAVEGKVVTVIGESFAGTTKLGDEAKVVDVYRDVCCMVIESSTNADGETVYQCKNQYTLYYPEDQGCQNKDSIYCEKRQWIIGDSGASIIKIYVKQIYIWAAGIIGFVAVTTIVLNGIRISVSGVSGDITQAKDRIIQAISGLVLLFLSGLILYTINPSFFS